MSDGAGERRKPGPKGSAAEKTLRDAAIMAALHAGEQVREVARRFELTPGQVGKIASAFRLRPTGLDQAPMEIIERVLRSYELQMQSFAALAAANAERMPAVAVAALRGHADSLERYREVMSDVGKLPTNLELFKSQAEVERLGIRVLEVLGRAAEGQISVAEAQDQVDRLLEAGPRHADIEGEAVDVSESEA